MIANHGRACLDIDITVPFRYPIQMTPPLCFKTERRSFSHPEKSPNRMVPFLSKQALIPWPKVSFLSGTFRRRHVTVLLSNSKYCELGHSQQAGALAVTVAKLFCNCDANSRERKEEDLGGGGSI